MRKVFILFLIFALLLVGCNNSDETTVSSEIDIVVLPDSKTAQTVNGYLNTSSITSLQTDSSISNNPTEEIYIGNLNSKKYHKSSCSYAKKISDKNLTSFSSIEAAQSAGFTPCGSCFK